MKVPGVVPPPCRGFCRSSAVNALKGGSSKGRSQGKESPCCLPGDHVSMVASPLEGSGSRKQNTGQGTEFTSVAGLEQLRVLGYLGLCTPDWRQPPCLAVRTILGTSPDLSASEAL